MELSESGHLLIIRDSHKYFYPHSATDPLKLHNVKESKRQTVLCLAAAHALVRLDDGTIAGDPMEKAALEALKWEITKGTRVREYDLNLKH